MSKLVTLHIQNYRGIKDLKCDFFGFNMCCLIGHCDSGKSTVLQAISILFAANWTIPISDEDFHKLNTSSPIRITGIVEDPPKNLLTVDKFGLDAFWRDEDNQQGLSLEMVLTVESDLNPRWEIHNHNNDEYHPISNKDRSLFNIRMIDDYFDTQFNMSKYSLLKSLVADIEGDAAFESNIGIDLIRDLKQQLNIGNDLGKKVSEKLNVQVASLGGEPHLYSLAVPTAELLLRGNQIALHAEDVPVRLMGKGSRRQLSLGLQLALSSSESSIILIDEIEQGLEPYKVKTIVRTLKDSGRQVFVTTHSNNVLCELDATDLFLLKKDAQELIHLSGTCQALLRTNQDAFFFDKLIVCEGETEYGFVLELDRYLWKENNGTLSSCSVSPIIGKGDNIVNVVDTLNSLDISSLCFMDSDKPKIISSLNGKTSLCCCEDGLAIEQQFFKDAPESTMESIVDEAKSCNRLPKSYVFQAQDRYSLGERAKNEEWFKSVGGGRRLGYYLFRHIEELDSSSCLYQQIQQLSSWIKGEAE